MKNKTGWIILLVIITLIIVYVYRSQISSIFMGSYTSTTTPSNNPQLIITKTDSSRGNYLVGENGMTLYTFDKDQPNTNNCSGTCATVWPAYTTVITPTELPMNLTIFTGPDGIMQYAYNNKPLYYYSIDKNSGDILGDGVGGVWHLVRP
jgi:predicted lipoprotein with Yx(FWY)xxD motif